MSLPPEDEQPEVLNPLEITEQDEEGWQGPGRFDEGDSGGLGALRNRFDLQGRQIGELQRSSPLRQAGIATTPDGLTVDSNLDVDGAVTIRDGAAFRVRYPGDTVTFSRIGRAVGSESGDYLGTFQLWIPANGDGSIAAIGVNPEGTGHAIQFRDKNLATVFEVHPDDARGMRRPTLEVPIVPIDFRTWPGSDSSSWATVARGGARLWHPEIYVDVRATSTATDTTGEVRVLIDDNNGGQFPLGSPGSVGFSISPHTFSGQMPTEVAIGSSFQIWLQVRRTAGTGDIRATAQQARLQ